MSNNKLVGIIVGLVLTVVIAVGAGFRLFEVIPNGTVGVQYSMNGGVQKKTLGQGVNFVGLKKVTKYSVRLNSTKVKKLNLSTKDGKATHVSITYSYKVDPSKVVDIYQEFGSANQKDLEDTWLKQRLLKASRGVVAKYSILDVMGARASEVQAEILMAFQEEVGGRGFLVDDLSLGVPDLDAETAEAINKVQLANQDKERASIEAEKLQIETQSKADAEIKTAEGKAKAITTLAEAESKANKERSSSITPEILKDKEMEARKTHGWVEIKGVEAVVAK